MGSWLEMSLLKEGGWSSWPCQPHPFWDVLVPNFCKPSCFQINADRQENRSIKPAQRIPSQVGVIWCCSLDFGVLLVYSGWRFVPEVLDLIQYYTVLHEIIINNLFISTFSPLGASQKQNTIHLYIYIYVYFVQFYNVLAVPIFKNKFKYESISLSTSPSLLEWQLTNKNSASFPVPHQSFADSYVDNQHILKSRRGYNCRNYIFISRGR